MTTVFYSVQKAKVRNWRPAKDGFFIKRTVTFQSVAVCHACYGEIKRHDDEKKKPRDCPECDDEGWIEEDKGGGNVRTYKCRACGGTGNK